MSKVIEKYGNLLILIYIFIEILLRKFVDLLYKKRSSFVYISTDSILILGGKKFNETTAFPHDLFSKPFILHDMNETFKRDQPDIQVYIFIFPDFQSSPRALQTAT